MNVVNLNSASLNSKRLNVIGDIRSSAGGGGGGDVPSYENGVYIQHIDGKLYTIDEWTAKGFANDVANGVAVVADEAKFVVAKDSLDRTAWSSNQSQQIEGIYTTTDSTDAASDYRGYENTQLMLETDTSGAALICANYVFPNGAKGYLPSVGELSIYVNAETHNIMKQIGGKPFDSETSGGDGIYWSSTQYSDTRAWVVMYQAQANRKNKYLTYMIRPFAKL